MRPLPFRDVAPPVPQRALLRHRARTPSGASHGFTLIELMVTLAVLAIILKLAAPSFANLLAANRMTTQTNELLGALNLAHSEAVRRAQPVTLRANDNDNYSLGWTVFPDADADGSASSPTDAADGLPLRVTESFNRSATIRRVTRSAAPFTYTNSTASDRMRLVFTSRGAITVAVTASAPAFFKICDPANPSVKGRIVQVNVVGKVSLDSISEPCT